VYSSSHDHVAITYSRGKIEGGSGLHIPSISEQKRGFSLKMKSFCLEGCNQEVEGRTGGR
jgi:hypothetical protein